MINIRKTKRYCNSDISLIENYELALNDTSKTWDCHHKKEITENCTRKDLIKRGMYWNQDPNDLIFLTRSEHVSLHNKYKQISEETKKKMSEANKGKHHFHHTEETKKKISETLKGRQGTFIGKHHTEETKKKMSNLKTGLYSNKSFWNNGEICIRAVECPEGFVKGRLPYNRNCPNGYKKSNEYDE